MKIVHITERTANKPVTRSRIANTNDIGVAWCFGATEHLPAESTTDFSGIDAVIYTMAKTKLPWESRWMQRAWEFKQENPAGKLIIYQEAEAYWPQIRPWDEQKQFYELLKVTDLFLTHNVDDEPLYKLMAGHENVRFFPAVTDISMLEGIPKAPPTFHDDHRAWGEVIVAAFHWRWGGIQAALTARKGFYRVVLNKAGVFTDGRDYDMQELFDVAMADWIPMLDWRAWATAMAKHWVYLHPMPGTAAGRDQIACAVIGLPIIGNHKSTPQQILWPDLIADPEDIRHHLQLLERLQDPAFYSRVVAMAKARVSQFGIDAGLEHAKRMIREMGWVWEWNNK